MITSKVMSNGRIAIPRVVLAALGLSTDDVVEWVIGDAAVTLIKATRAKFGRGASFIDPFATFLEWKTQEDDEAFSDI